MYLPLLSLMNFDSAIPPIASISRYVSKRLSQDPAVIVQGGAMR